ncbi:MAG: hypothetical protein V2J62_02525 [candidate division KSB1 bacterium]|jgi:hypothetical protein|nr:hypothetical protein [candidate division KSB1 bacterium]
MDVELSKFPYPYKAALSICSDIDGTSLDRFIEIHKFLNTTKPTPMGDGLGLHITDSFWMYDDPGISDSAFSYYSGSLPGPAAPIIRDFICAGILDTMHAYGNFRNKSEFSREKAEKALNELEKHGLKIRVWTNHGGTNSIQNIGKQSSGEGDVPDTTWYHADLLRDFGIRYYWDCERALMTTVGQNRKASFGDAYWRSPLYSGLRQNIKATIKGIASYADRMTMKLLNTHIVKWPVFDPRDNDLIVPDTLRDDRPIYKFRRGGLGNLDWSDHIPVLLNPRVLEELVTNGGSAVLYVHMGDRMIAHNADALSPETVKTLKEVAQLYRNGLLWVAGTNTLLNHQLVTKYLDWTAENVSTDKLKITIRKRLLSPIEEVVEVDELAGVTFIIPEKFDAEILFENIKIKYEVLPHDNPEKRTLQIPLNNIDWPL